MDGLCRFGGAVSLAHKPQTSVQEDLSAQQLRSHLHDTGQGPGGWRPERTVKTVKLEGVTLTRSMLASSQIPTLASKLPLLCHFHWRCEVSIVSHSQVLVGFQCTNSTQDFPTRLSLNALYTYTLKISSVKYRSMPFWTQLLFARVPVVAKFHLKGLSPIPSPTQIWLGCRGEGGVRGQCDGQQRSQVLVMDPESHTVAKELQAHSDSIETLCSAEDRYVLSGSARRDGKIAIWKVE